MATISPDMRTMINNPYLERIARISWKVSLTNLRSQQNSIHNFICAYLGKSVDRFVEPQLISSCLCSLTHNEVKSKCTFLYNFVFPKESYKVINDLQLSIYQKNESKNETFYYVLISFREMNPEAKIYVHAYTDRKSTN